MTVNILWFTLGGIYRSDDQDPKRPSALILPEIEVYPGGENTSSYYSRQLRVVGCELRVWCSHDDLHRIVHVSVFAHGGGSCHHQLSSPKTFVV